MPVKEATPTPKFKGRKADKEIAADAFNVMRAMGRFFPKTAPIRASMASLGEYFASSHGEKSAEEWETAISKIVRQNSDVFGSEEVDGTVYVITTLAGEAPAVPPPDEAHLLAQRFAEPKQEPERPPKPLKRAKVAHLPEAAATELVGGPALESIESEYAEIESSAFIADSELEAIEQAALEAVTAAVVEQVVTDVGELSDDVLAGVVASQLRDEITVASFGDLWMTEEKVPRLSRGDLRRLREYLLERNEPLTDEVLLQDVIGTRPGADDYDLMRFALNYRLSRESREFEYMGTSMQRYWSTSGLPTIGTSKRKPSEIGTDYRYVLDEEPANLPEGETVVEHVLTFYEYQYGVLPLDGLLGSLFPKPDLPDQRAAVLVFESPQTYETFFVEAHFPTNSRGGYVIGLDRFFLENLVPGALFTIERSESDGRFLIEYLPVSGEDRKLLQIDEKRARYVFRPMTFYCATQENMVVSENRFPQLANMPLLDERVRRRPDLTLEAMFERIGEQVGTSDASKFMVMLDDLAPACNIERPMSPDLIRSIVASGANPSFSTDPDVEDVFYYEPANS